MRFTDSFFVQVFELFVLDHVRERVVDLFELRLITGLVHGELRRVQTYDTWYTRPQLSEKCYRDRDVSMLDNDMTE